MSTGEQALVGRRLGGRYRVEAELGRGGMGVVYRARHEALDRPVALKVLRPELSGDGVVFERFRREARTASALGHAHIARVLDFGRLEDGSAFLVMDLVEGRSLRARIEAEGPLPVRDALRIATEVCEALEAAHAAGVVHRDLKPDNVLLEGAAEAVKVVDFGIAKMASSEADVTLTKTGEVVGTPLYMSPEQCGGRDLDGRSDLYALGAILFEMLTGRPPFFGDSLVSLVTQHVMEPAPSARASRPELPHELDALVAACLAKAPDDRPPTARALADRLEAVASERTRLETGPTMAPDEPAAVAPGLGGSAAPRSAPPGAASETAAGAASEAGARSAPGTASGVGGTSEPDAPSATGTASDDGAAPDDGAPAPHATGAARTTTGALPTRPRWPWAFGALLLGVATGGVWIWSARSTPEPPAALEPAAAMGTTTVRVRSEPSGAAVFEGERLLGQTPLEVPVAERPRRLVLSAPGRAESELTLEPGATGPVRVSLVPTGVEQPARDAPPEAADAPAEPTGPAEPSPTRPATSAHRPAPGPSAPRPSPEGATDEAHPTNPDIADPWGR